MPARPPIRQKYAKNDPYMTMGISIPRSVRAQLEAAREVENRPFCEIICSAMREYFERHQQKQEV